MISIKGCNLLLGVISLFGKTETSTSVSVSVYKCIDKTNYSNYN